MFANRVLSAKSDARSESRDEVLHRTRVIRDDGTPLTVTIVNTSPRGLMARTEGAIEPGARVTVLLPIVGRRAATVRWSLGGRIGCQLDEPIPTDRYYEMIAAARR